MATPTPLQLVIFTQSLDTGALPEDWLSANISPVFKKGSRNYLSFNNGASLE